MKILIAYTSKNGTTAKCARMLADKLEVSHEVRVSDMNKEDTVSPEGFDVVVLGSSVRMGAVSKKLKKYIKANVDMLNAKMCAVFLCCGFPDEFEEYVSTQIPKALVPSLGIHCFGGELKPREVRGFDKIIVRMIRNSITGHDFEDGNYTGMLPEIIPEHINILADRVMGR